MGKTLTQVDEKAMDRYARQFTVTEEEMPEIKNWRVGSTYPIVANVKLVALVDEQGNEYPVPVDSAWAEMEKMRDKGLQGKFEIVSIGAEEEDYQEEFARNMSGANA
jgi:hypothetical protein